MVEKMNGAPPFKFRVELALTEDEKIRRKKMYADMEAIDPGVRN